MLLTSTSESRRGASFGAGSIVNKECHMKQSAIVRLGGIRAVAIFLLNIAGALISILLLPAALLYPIASGHRPVVEVRDEAGIYHEQALRHGLEEQVYDREVRIAVLSVPGSGISNIDEEIVKYASDGTQGSSWFKDSDVDSPVNGTILFVVAPESHWVRCYAAKDLQLSADKRTAIENAAGSHYAQSDWDDGTVAMGRQLAIYIGSSDGSSMIVRVVGGVLAFPVGTGWLVYYLWRGMTARRRAQGARHEMMRIVYTYDLTELQVGTVPEESHQSRDVGSDYRRFHDEYDTVSQLWKDFGEPHGAQWFGRGVLAQATRLAERTAGLAELDAAVNAGAAARADTAPNPGGAVL